MSATPATRSNKLNESGGPMSDVAILITAFAGLAVAVGALLVSIGVFVLVVKIGVAFESIVGSARGNDTPSNPNQGR